MIVVIAVAANNTFMTAESVERLLRLPVLVSQVPRGGQEWRRTWLRRRVKLS